MNNNQEYWAKRSETLALKHWKDEAKVEKKLELKGTETSPLYIKEGDRV